MRDVLQYVYFDGNLRGTLRGRWEAPWEMFYSMFTLRGPWEALWETCSEIRSILINKPRDNCLALTYLRNQLIESFKKHFDKPRQGQWETTWEICGCLIVIVIQLQNCLANLEVKNKTIVQQATYGCRNPFWWIPSFCFNYLFSFWKARAPQSCSAWEAPAMREMFRHLKHPGNRWSSFVFPQQEYVCARCASSN
jgi:hypothetical protein